MRRLWKILFFISLFVAAEALLFTFFPLFNTIPIHYANDYFAVDMNTVIRHFKINGTDILAKYQMFQCEEDYQLEWKPETPVRVAWTATDEDFTVFTYSQLYTYDCFKTFIFHKHSPSFTVEITKAYHITGWSDNNQIIADVYNDGFTMGNNCFTFHGKTWNMTIAILKSDPLMTIEAPPWNTTELQFNFNGKADRDLAYHMAGQMETALFNVTLSIMPQ
jgi:hypothetical protein